MCMQCGSTLTKRGKDINDINEEIEVFKHKYSEVDVRDQLERFIYYLGANGRRYKNYIMAFHNWCKRSAEMSPGNPVKRKKNEIDWDSVGRKVHSGR